MGMRRCLNLPAGSDPSRGKGSCGPGVPGEEPAESGCSESGGAGHLSGPFLCKQSAASGGGCRERLAGRSGSSGDEGTGLAGEDPGKGAVTRNGRDRTPVLGPRRSALQEPWRKGWENSRETSPQTPPKLSFTLIFTFFLQTLLVLWPQGPFHRQKDILEQCEKK